MESTPRPRVKSMPLHALFFASGIGGLIEWGQAVREATGILFDSGSILAIFIRCACTYEALVHGPGAAPSSEASDVDSSRDSRRATVVLLAAVVAVESPRGLRAQSLSLPTYTASQAVQGKQAYERSCAACHGANLDDGEFAPPLKGADFRLRWGGKPVDTLFDEVMQTMPPGSPGSLGDETFRHRCLRT